MMNALSSTPSEQPALFDLPPRFAVSMEKQVAYSAAHLKARHPEWYRAVVVLSGYGLGQLAIARALGMSHHLVSLVQVAEGCEIAIEKEARSKQCKRIQAMAGEIVERQLSAPNAEKDLELRDVAAVLKIAHTSALELDGEATLRVDVRVSAAPQHEALNAFVRRERQSTHLGAEKPAHMRDGTSAARNGGGSAPGEVVDVAVLPVLPERAESVASLPNSLPQAQVPVIPTHRADSQ